ncbi:hypothetical protein LOTGIDRAFT_161913 [Lottia gigantea]|uniref:Uncharacterized protein n=1 Tax=Lottia gigantea TaxID=225164 RepID=V3ZPR0_LOTGI|nr:hypothetical protein LOTGIDRAFT_161913 [Lottia gigantea]ESO93348.1 hypothetical protein LOTGIDRAFT_161913 [Lottia gigantea]
MEIKGISGVCTEHWKPEMEVKGIIEECGTDICKVPDSRSLSLKGLDELRLCCSQQKGNDHFDTRKELEDYCRDDVNLLRGGRGVFLKLFDGLTALPAFHSSSTIASLAMMVYRTNFLPNLTIATTQPTGFLKARKQSSLALRYLQEFSENVEIKHARNSGEHRVQTLAVNGYYHCPFRIETSS